MAHWSETKEKASGLWQLRFMYWLYKLLGLQRMKWLVHPVVLGIFLFSPQTRRVSKLFHTYRAEVLGNPGVPKGEVYRHFHSFAYVLFEKLGAWAGDLHVRDLVPQTPDVNHLIELLKKKKGAVILCSHLGNTEMLRALASTEVSSLIPDFAINSIVEFSGTAKFNQLLAEINPASMVRLVDAKTMGADTIIELRTRLDEGELVVIAGDRTASQNQGKFGTVSFLGRDAYFPQGAFILASLMDAPVFHMFALRSSDSDYESPYEFHVYESKIDLTGSRRERMVKIQSMMEEFAGILERLCLKHPLQWFNFSDFWKKPEGKKS